MCISRWSFLSVFSLFTFSLAAQVFLPKLQGGFRVNNGQWPAEVNYRFSIPSGEISFLSNGISVGVCSGNTGRTSQPKRHELNETVQRGEKGKMVVWNLRFAGGNAKPEILSSGKQEAYANYLQGNDSSRWSTNVPQYDELVYKNAWNNIDVKFSESGGKLKYDLILRPGARISDIRLSWEGIDSLATDGKKLAVYTPAGMWEETIPASFYAGIGSTTNVNVYYIITGKNEISFRTDDSIPATATFDIDPVVLAYSTFVSGSGTNQSNGQLWDMDVDAAGFVYACGEYWDATYPTTAGSYDPTFNGGNMDGYVFKLNQAGTNLVYCTYFGGNDDDEATAITIDANGDVYFGGVTGSPNLPVTPGVFQPALATTGQYGDAYVAHLDAAGSGLVWSSYLGGAASIEYFYDIELDSSGNVYVTGQSISPDFPVTTGAFDVTHNGSADAYVCKINPAATAILYATFLGGSMTDIGVDLAVNAAGEVFVTGMTLSNNFPVTPGSFQPAFNGGQMDVFLTRLDASGSVLAYSTYIGAGSDEYSDAVVINAADEAFVTGYTSSSAFPLANAFDNTYNGGAFYGDAFLLKMNAQGNNLIYSTYIGGTFDDFGVQLAVTKFDEIWITGSAHINMGSAATTDNFPVTTCAYDSTINNTGQVGNSYADVFLAKFSADGSTILWSTYFGGSGQDLAEALQLIENCGEEVYVGATIGFNYTNSILFPTTAGAFQQVPGDDLNDQPAVLKFTFTPVIDATFSYTDNGCAGGIFTGQPDSTADCNTLAAMYPNISWQWDFGDNSSSGLPAPAHTYAAAGTYTVTVTAGCGNAFSDTITVSEPCIQAPVVCGEVFLPNAFSPNSDGQNDVLFVRGDCIAEMQFDIYNRWGERVFSSSDQSTGWDGMWRGTPCETAVFTYMLRAVLVDGTPVTMKGNISLVK